MLASPDSSVTISLPITGTTLPLLIESAKGELDIASWISEHRGFLDAALLRHGGLLLRGFSGSSVERFEEIIVAASSDDWVEYREAATPRSHVRGHIFTSTEYSPKNSIYVHNENSHVTTWPAKLFFFCRTAPATGGETPLADVRRVYRRIPEAIRERFFHEGWLYARTFGFRLGFSWQKVFAAATRDEVNRYCERNYMIPEWLEGDRLRIRYRRWAALEHPQTGDMVWFNHGVFYNLWNLEPELKPLARVMGEYKMPYNTYYGSGVRVPDSVLETIDAAYRAETVKFPWQPRDVLVLDNMLVAHGRRPYTGAREIFVGMTELIRCEDVAGAETYRTS